MAEENVINIDGKEYTSKDLNNQQKYYINQLNDLKHRSDTLRGQLDQIERSFNSFQQDLFASIKEGQKEKKEAS